MSKPPAVFISHKTDGQLWEIRDLFHAKLRDHVAAGKLHVQIDREDPAGEEFWKKNIFRYVAECACAVIFLDEAALGANPPFVPMEVTLLWQQYIVRGIKLIPVLGPGITQKGLRDHPSIGSTGLPDVNPVRWRPSADEMVHDICRAADIQTLVTHNPDPEVEDWIQELVGHLPKEDAAHFTIKALVELGAANDPGSELLGLTPTALRRRLASALIETHDVDRLTVAIVSVDRLNFNNRARVGRLLAPLWVREGLAQQLRVLATQGKSPGPEILLSANHDESGFAVVQRAFRCAQGYRWRPDEGRWADNTGARPRLSRSSYIHLRTSETGGYSDLADCLDERILECCGEIEVDNDAREQTLLKCLANLTKDTQRPAFVQLRLEYYDCLDHERYRGFVFLVLRRHGPPVAGARLAVMQPDLETDDEEKGRQYVLQLQTLFHN